MDRIYYLREFQKCLDRMDEKSFRDHRLELKVGVWRNAVALKIQKKAWIDGSPAAKPFEGSIFFSVWVNEGSIREGRLLYNIHALKLRELKGYSIKSRDFAESFRSAFRPFEKEWPNVSLSFGPLTLMEGWVRLDLHDPGPGIKELAYKFSEIAFIIDDLLEERRRV
jgi:hypothetical protein